MAAPALSVVVPMYNEEDSAGPLVEAVRSALGDAYAWELILVDDGSRDRTVERIAVLMAADPRVRLVRLARNYGQTPAMQAGFDAARGDVVVTMDGDLQNDPRDIPAVLARLDEGYDLVAGYRERRQDVFLKRRLPSLIANWLIRQATGVPIRDNGCSLKAFRRPVVDQLHLYSDMHRFIPAVAAATAGARITEMPVRHHARRFGQSKYGLSRIAKVLADLLVIIMIRSFRDRPLHLFAGVALVAFLFGILAVAASAIAMAYFTPVKATALVFPSVALVWFATAGYLLMLGLVAEAAVRRYGRRVAPVAALVQEVR
ncbi:MAG: glycosyltransferase family 2 protein [Gemmatimonadetes bacterium]|nr:glycosyltransferase family 2 protein [Gemmatimonadota bacterium]